MKRNRSDYNRGMARGQIYASHGHLNLKVFKESDTSEYRQGFADGHEQMAKILGPEEMARRLEKKQSKTDYEKGVFNGKAYAAKGYLTPKPFKESDTSEYRQGFTEGHEQMARSLGSEEMARRKKNNAKQSKKLHTDYERGLYNGKECAAKGHLTLKAFKAWDSSEYRAGYAVGHEQMAKKLGPKEMARRLEKNSNKSKTDYVKGLRQGKAYASKGNASLKEFEESDSSEYREAFAIGHDRMAKKLGPKEMARRLEKNLNHGKPKVEISTTKQGPVEQRPRKRRRLDGVHTSPSDSEVTPSLLAKEQRRSLKMGLSLPLSSYHSTLSSVPSDTYSIDSSKLIQNTGSTAEEVLCSKLDHEKNEEEKELQTLLNSWLTYEEDLSEDLSGTTHRPQTLNPEEEISPLPSSNSSNSSLSSHVHQKNSVKYRGPSFFGALAISDVLSKPQTYVSIKEVKKPLTYISIKETENIEPENLDDTVANNLPW